jgi:hypothetical protein
VPLRPSPPELEVAVVWRRHDASPMIGEFVKAARDAFAHRRRVSGHG